MAHTITHNNHRGHHAYTNDYDERSEALQRRRYGGFNFGAAFFGWIVATGMAVILTAILAAAGSTVALNAIDGVNVQNATNTVNTETARTVGLVSGALLLAALSLAYYAGGYVAGRMSRFDGARQGFGTWAMGFIVMIVLGILGAILGSEFNILQNINLPALPVDGQSLSSGGLFTFLLITVATLLAAVTGGKIGERYHHKVDAAAEN